MSKRKGKNSDEIVEGALAGGLIGAALGAILLGKSKDTLAAALLGAAIGASVSAMKEAEEKDIPVMIEENGVLYYLNGDGSKTRIRKVRNAGPKLPSRFNIG